VHVAYAQALLTSTSDAVIGFDLGGRVQSWNPAAEQLLLWVTDDAVGRAAPELFTVEPPSRPGQILNPVSAGESARGDYWLRRHDGSRIEVDVRAAPIRSDDGSVVGVLV
jgi:PAS domain S-box-containing protein